MAKRFPSSSEIEARLRDMIRGDRIPDPPAYNVPLTDVSVPRAQLCALLSSLADRMSHEIRNALATIFLHVELLEEELRQPPPESGALLTAALTEIKRELARLGARLQEYLSLARMPPIECTPQDLGVTVQTWAHEWQPWAAAHGVTLTLDGIADLGNAAFHESTLHRAVRTLVQNALEAMPQGGILTLAGQRTAMQVQLHVRDTGSGIPAEHLAQIFEPLYTTKETGTGLGLSLVREIITAHAGQITVQSAVGHGTTFTITLPVATP